jgi:hypothetical protein
VQSFGAKNDCTKWRCNRDNRPGKLDRVIHGNHEFPAGLGLTWGSNCCTSEGSGQKMSAGDPAPTAATATVCSTGFQAQS